MSDDYDDDAELEDAALDDESTLYTDAAFGVIRADAQRETAAEASGWVVGAHAPAAAGPEPGMTWNPDLRKIAWRRYTEIGHVPGWQRAGVPDSTRKRMRLALGATATEGGGGAGAGAGGGGAGAGGGGAGAAVPPPPAPQAPPGANNEPGTPPVDALPPSDAVRVSCELCKWDRNDRTGKMALIDAEYERYVKKKQGRSNMWQNIADTFNKTCVSVTNSMRGATIEKWKKANRGKPRRVEATDCMVHYTGRCGRDIVNPHREKRCLAMQGLWDELYDDTRRIPIDSSGQAAIDGAEPATQVVHRPTVNVLVSLNKEIMQLEKAIQTDVRDARGMLGGAPNARVRSVHGVGSANNETYNDT